MVLMPMVVRHLQLHLTQREELQQCVDILSELLIILEDTTVVCMTGIVHQFGVLNGLVVGV